MTRASFILQEVNVFTLDKIKQNTITCILVLLQVKLSLEKSEKQKLYIFDILR